ncbi:MAG: citrate/2-methylcitrate synthase [Myxococcaceae bacterium]
MSAPEDAGLPVAAIRTRVGRAEYDEHLFFGHRVFADLRGRTRHLGLVALAVGGPRLSEADCALLDDASTCFAFADPRVWPLKATRLVASFGSPLAGVAAGLLCSEGALLGPRVIDSATRMLAGVLARLGEAVEDPAAVEEETLRLLAVDGRLPGFGVPARESDERFLALRERLVQLGRARGRFVRLAERIAVTVARAKGTPPNVALLAGALLLELGFLPAQAFVMAAMMVQFTILANAVEGAEQCAAVLQRLPDQVVRYEGVPARVSPRGRRGSLSPP